MKKLILILLLITCLSGYAQTSDYRARGYKGNISFGINADLSCEGAGFSLSTTHGMQFNKFLFVGGGIGYENEMLPIYAAARSYFTKRELRANPWAEMRMGIDALYVGYYLSPSVGFSIPLQRGFAISAALAYACSFGFDCAEHNLGLRVGFHF